jgi:hypothetical protein
VIACGDSTATDATARIATIEETAMAEATSNSETLFNGLLELARGDSSRVSELQRRLLDPAVLDVLDSKADYETEMPEDLYIAGLIQALMDRGDAAAHKVLSQLALAPAWADEDARIELLIRALATVRPATPEAIAFWDKYSEPEDGFANLTIDACIVNGSSPAIDLVATKLIDAKHSVEMLVPSCRRLISERRHGCWSRKTNRPLTVAVATLGFAKTKQSFLHNVRFYCVSCRLRTDDALPD